MKKTKEDNEIEKMKKEEIEKNKKESNEKKKIEESHLIKTIIVGADWEEVLTMIIEEEEIDPMDIDIVKLVDAVLNYLKTLKKFDFRIPARFILIAAILLRMKCEVLKIKDIEEKREERPTIDINVPLIELPVIRRPTRPIALTELIDALNKVIQFEERKKLRALRLRKAVEALIEEEEDIEVRINKIYEEIRTKRINKFSELVGEWKREKIVYKFIPLLHLDQSGKISCEQLEEFGEILINLKEDGESESNLNKNILNEKENLNENNAENKIF
ncbi:MAG: segregation/condensation protein A [Candidatus Aenigmatarchaeota archaeon]